MPARPPYRLLVVEDHPVMRDGYAQLIGAEADLVVAAMVETAEEGLALVEASRAEPAFDLALVDISLPGMDGLELVRRLSRVQPALRTIVVTGHHESHYEHMAAEAGADRFLWKGDPYRLLDTIREVLRP